MSELMENNAGFQPGPISPVCTSEQLYTVKPGDTMFFIAKRNNISLQELINANPQIADPNTIYPGQVICIPMAPTAPGCAGNQTYRVVSGDTMFEIARRFGVTLDALIAANPQIPDPNLIFPGQEICIPLPLMAPMPAPMPVPIPAPIPAPILTPIPAPIPAPILTPMPAPIPAPGPCYNGTYYTVNSGDTLFDIARANNITLTSLIAANPQIPDPNLIYPGQVICIPAPVLEIPPAPQPTCPITLPAPVMPIQQPLPMPAPRPVMPIEQPMPCPAFPAPRPVIPIEQPVPCPAAPVPMPYPAPCPMPFYVVVPWDECPHRFYKKKRHGRKKRCH